MKVNSVVVYIYMLGGIDLNETKTCNVINWVLNQPQWAWANKQKI